ncbi:MAG: hypothetical protein N4A74_18825 [Carboxylicivirga sp.]|jgi:hypothetical protein|nr:hypothetical protein [Carboxylicivirga sp.]
MRKLTSHFYLRKDGTFGKRPIVHLADDGTVTDLRESGSDFKEEPSLEYYPGILVPGFVASVSSDSINSVKGKCLVNGVLRIQPNKPNLESDVFFEAWKNIQEQAQLVRGEDSLGSLLHKYTYEAANLINAERWGRIDIGSNPGILVIQNLDLRRFTFTPGTRFKILQR